MGLSVGVVLSLMESRDHGGKSELGWWALGSFAHGANGARVHG